ncbi:unnamed protein product [Hyaloperonospora brassicae]|uniref:6-phosphogluconolactonase n=1 Tax=Hyaloperonospora brassicae TaxID=162125 RepID=A0AAV0U7C1_HYABA|nr:unnamed protein product [Hyaloperonospora brassicae]
MPTLYVGTYTRKEAHVDGHAKGIYAYSFNDVTGALKLLHVASDVGTNPSYVVGTASTLYVVNECNAASTLCPNAVTGYVAAYATSPNGHLTPLSRHETGGAYACHVALSPTNDFVSVANYAGGLSLFPVHADGSLAPASAHCRLEGASCVRPDRQEASHIHSTVWTSTGLLAADLGTDAVVQYTLNRRDQRLERQGLIPCLPGAGPRHMALSLELGVCYVLNELDNTVCVHALDAATGALAHEALQVVSTLPTDYNGPPPLASDIHIAPSNKFVYAATRFSDTIAIYRIRPDTRLALVDIVPTRGATPRDILLYRDFLLVGHQDSNSLDVFRVDADTGRVTYTNHSIECPSPACMFIAE